MKYFLPVLLAMSCLISNGQSTNKLHFNSVLIDTHNDILSEAMGEGVDISHRVTSGHSDLDRWKEGGVDVQFFSIWTGFKARTEKGYYQDAVTQIKILDTLLKRNPDRMVLARNYSDVKKGIKQQKFVALIGVEGGHMIEDDLTKLQNLFDLGMRYMTLTWNNNTSWATSAMYESGSSTFPGSDASNKATQQSVNTVMGLNDFGKQVVRRMNELGIIVDLSHTGEKTFYDALATTTKPVILSHSSVWNLCPVFRNVKDDQIKAIAKNQGVICINFYSGFISRRWDSLQRYFDDHGKTIADIKWPGLDSVETRKNLKAFRDWTLDANRPTLSDLVDHIDYIVKLVGDDYVGIGSDYDGVGSLPMGMDDVTTYPKITEELVKRHYSKKSIQKILGGNALRVMKANF